MKMKLEIGDRVERITIIGPIVTMNGKESYSPVRCDCGKEWMASRGGIRKGRIKSCGCLAREKIRERATRHGHRPRAWRSPEYATWDSMIQRCCNPKSAAYEHYGARGITVCAAWRASFEAFFADMGPRPSPEHEIERTDNSRGYEPGNCVWATRHAQMRNTRYNRFVDVDGERLCVLDAARKIAVPAGRIYWRVHKRGVTHQQAFDHVRREAAALEALLGGQLGGAGV